jgi:hypothetical protein
LINFKNMRNASYDPVRDSIILEPGIHWQEAVSALEPFGVAPVGGKVVPFLYCLVLTGYLDAGRVGYAAPFSQ